MKYIYTVIIFFYFGSCYCIQQQFDYFTRQSFTQENIEFQKIEKSKIKNRKLYSAYYGRNGNLPPEKTLVEEINFKDGLPVEKLHYNSYGEIRSKYDYTYNKNNNMIKEEIYNEYDNIIFRKEISYTSNRDTNEVVLSNIRKKGKEIRKFSYDSMNRLIGINNYNSNDKIYLSQKFIYKGDKLTSIEFLDGDGKKFEESVFTYNKIGNLLSETNNNITKKYIYDDKDRLIRVESNKGDIRIYKYNDKNFIVDDQFFIEHNKRQFRLVFNYLKNGLAGEVIRYDSDDKKAFYSKYTYE